LSGGNAAREGHDMRAIACGEHLEAASDEELMPMVQEHMEQVHPDMQMSDEEKQALFTQMVHDV
jgi:predicted small metal-binding protein